MTLFSRLGAWLRSLFSRPSKPAPTNADPHPAPASPQSRREACPWAGPIDTNTQLELLLNCGVYVWNMRRRSNLNRFWPDLTRKPDLHEEARQGSMVWGVPVDLSGGPRLVLSGIDLADANLRGVRFVPRDILSSAAGTAGADLRGANLGRADLRESSLLRCNLEGATLRHADLRNADLRRATLVRADLENANLSGAKLDGANLAWANLAGAIVAPEALRKANLFGARLSTASIAGHRPANLFMGRSMGRHVRLEPVGDGTG
jgi:hypothetical protein